MTKGPDLNDTLRNEGEDAVRARSDRAEKYEPNGGTAPASSDITGGKKSKRGRSSGKATADAPEFSDEALALSFAAAHADDLRYVAAWSSWLMWDGCLWHFDDTLRAYDLVRQLCRTASTVCRKPDKANGLASAKTVAAVERLARSDRRLAASVEQWDADPWLLTCTTVTVDLRTGIERSPCSRDYITKRTACDPAPKGTPHPVWSAFLDRITAGNTELQQFLQRDMGYSLTGITTEQSFTFAHGGGANGKSTLINTIVKIFGDYATTADMNTFLANNYDRHPTDLAKLHGARLVVAQEMQQGRSWDETKIKALTGGDRISARFMRQDDFEFEPKFKLFITGNHKPKLATIDEAMHRRLLLVPFTVQIPKSERDPHLMQKLEAEWPAILRWVIDGCLEWQRIGLAPPSIVQEATQDYFDDEDTISQWLEEKCDVDLGNEFKYEPVADLFESWSAFATRGGCQPGSKNDFSEQLKNRGFKQKRTTKTRYLVGLRLKV